MATAPPLLKRFGQHHLVDPRLCRPLVEYLEAAPKPSPVAREGLGTQRVVEIGPGGGVLTEALLAAGARVWALEVDPAWAFELRRRFPEAISRRQLSITLSDALAFSWRQLGGGARPVLAAGNLPYNVATPILETLLPHHRVVSRAAFLVQKEVADRLVARPGDPAYGALSVLVAARAEARALGRVRPGSFRPPPKVAGGFVGLDLRPPPLPEPAMPAFERTVKLAFGQRRKSLRNALAADWGKEDAQAALAAAGIDPGLRAEALGLDHFVALHRARTALLAASTPTSITRMEES